LSNVAIRSVAICCGARPSISQRWMSRASLPSLKIAIAGELGGLPSK
jgi:hypothetical protein